MSVIYTNENNPAGLKLVVAKNYAKQEVAVKIVNIHDRNLEPPKHLPYLEVDGEVLFSVNSALLYLYPLPNNADTAVAFEWLEWDSTVLSPCLGSIIGSNLKSDHLKHTLLAALKKLDNFLQNKKFLVNNTLTVVDISLWCSLYPLIQFGNNESFGDYLFDLKNITQWFNNIQADAIFQTSLNNFPLKGCHPSYNSLFSGAKYLVSSTEQEHTQQKTIQYQGESVTEEELEAAERAFSEEYDRFPVLKQPAKVVLPTPEEKNIFITSALPYVNNVPHLGNIIGCVLSADVFARFSRLCNYNTLYICGTDEYGTATETKALEEGLSCQEICDKYHKIHRETYEWFNISFDYFGRTSTPQQTELCQDLFLKLNDNGFMFTQSVEQLHCEKCNRYLADRFVEGGCPNVGCNYEDARGDQCDGCGKLVNAVELKNPRCKICRNTPKLKTSNQFFIDLPKLEPLVHHWMKKSAPGWSNNAQVIAKAWLKEGLKPRCITRDLKWGVPVPLDGFRNKVFYVWFDAPIGYMSISKAYTKEFEKWWIPAENTKISLYQFMAKDNVPFHSVLFPAMLLGANRGYNAVSHIMATEYLNYEDGKFSKSRGVGVFGTDVQQTGIPSDVWRFYLLYVRPETQDSSFSWVDLATKNNSELLNNLGNFINRSLVFAKNNFKGVVPQKQLTEEDTMLLALCTKEFKCYVAALQKSRLRDGIRHILAISKLGNQYMQSNQPWVLVKGTDEQKLRAGTVINVCCNLVALLEMLLRPYMPETSANLQKQLNSKNLAINPLNIRIIQLTPPGHKLGEPSPLFTKIETAQIEDLKTRFGGKQSERVQPSDLEIQVQKQADKVRIMKSSGVEKSIWQPEVAILLDLKKKLEASKKSAPSPAVVSSGSPEDVKKLEDEIAQQGNKVRSLKASGVEKSVWQPEVGLLLTLKKKLEDVQKLLKSSSGEPAPGKGNPAEIKQLEDKVAEQALKVRKLKEAKAEKSVWQPEVDVLLKLKNQLAAVSGVPIQQPQKGKKGK